MLSALRNFALTFAISALIFGVIAYFIVGFVVDTMTDAIPGGVETEDTSDDIFEDTSYNPIITPGTTGTESVDTVEPPVVEDPINGDTFNILLIGSDYQPELFDDYDYEEKWRADPNNTGFPDKRNRPWGADAIILVRIDKENRQFVFCPIPRNTRISVDGEYMQLGDVISSKSVEFLCGKVAGLTGLEMDYYVHVTVGAIKEIVDSVGGLTYYVPEDMVYEDPEQQLSINLKKGTNNITGEKAMQLLRYVGYANGNAGRMNTSVEFLKAVLAKFTNITYLAKAPELYSSVLNSVETNFTADDLVNNLDLIFAYPKFEAITVTYPGSAKAYNGVTYFEPTVAAAMDMFDSFTN